MPCRLPGFFAPALIVGLIALPPVGAQPKEEGPRPDAELVEKLAAVRDTHKVPAVFGAIIEGEQLVAVAAVGVRKVGVEKPVTVNDQVHLGSNTKAMTATLIAALIERGKLRWDSTIGGVLPGLKDKIHDDYLGVTIEQLLTQRGGVVPNVVWWAAPEDKTTREQRTALLPVILKKAPTDKPGTKYRYSNASYVVVGAMAEAAADASWEDLMRATLFKPLGMTSAGFGPPGKKGEVDQPWGHDALKDEFKPTRHDNHPVLGPAGTIHASLPDWAKFAGLHLQAARGKARLLKPESFARLHKAPEGFDYAGGWLVGKDGSLAHDGSNNYWYARVRILPKKNRAILAVVNAGGDAGTKAVEAAELSLLAYARDRADKK
jgi:CubicO group peptidase (beta-lactamase class C family)